MCPERRVLDGRDGAGVWDLSLRPGTNGHPQLGLKRGSPPSHTLSLSTCCVQVCPASCQLCRAQQLPPKPLPQRTLLPCRRVRPIALLFSMRRSSPCTSLRWVYGDESQRSSVPGGKGTPLPSVSGPSPCFGQCGRWARCPRHAGSQETRGGLLTCMSTLISSSGQEAKVQMTRFPVDPAICVPLKEVKVGRQ